MKLSNQWSLRLQSYFLMVKNVLCKGPPVLHGRTLRNPGAQVLQACRTALQGWTVAEFSQGTVLMPYICYNLSDQNSETFALWMMWIMWKQISQAESCKSSMFQQKFLVAVCIEARASERQSKIRKARWGRGKFSWRSCVFGWDFGAPDEQGPKSWLIKPWAEKWWIVRPRFLQIKIISHCGLWTLFRCRCEPVFVGNLTFFSKD